jgi:hypothetical protein
MNGELEELGSAHTNMKHKLPHGIEEFGCSKQT